ncbi:hypothetical protein V1318_02505 [Lysobacter sp. CCNWLW3]|uniref:hypothetical protein n=1 Tax=unclassified Lysobacter TaxID=2635362 RepID=UPI002FCE83C4
MSNIQWFDMGAKGHHGYPQPENSWANQTYNGHCDCCGVYESQAASFRFRKSNRASHSHFRQLNWVFDAWFVTPEVESVLRQNRITGIDFCDALGHQSGLPLEHLRQLVITGVTEGVDTSELPTVTCKPFNEEADSYSAPLNSPFCGTVKYHPPTSIVIPEQALLDTPDLSLTTTWFGSGFGAWHYTIASRKFYDLVQAHGWRGLELSPILHSGHSRRAV